MAAFVKQQLHAVVTSAILVTWRKISVSRKSFHILLSVVTFALEEFKMSQCPMPAQQTIGIPGVGFYYLVPPCSILLSERLSSVLLLIWDSTGGSMLVEKGGLLPLPLVGLLLLLCLPHLKLVLSPLLVCHLSRLDMLPQLCQTLHTQLLFDTLLPQILMFLFYFSSQLFFS